MTADSDAQGANRRTPGERTARASDGRRPLRFSIATSRLGRLIIGLNMLGLAVLIVGALVLNEFRRGLVETRVDSLTTQGEFIANVIGRAATRGEPEPRLIPPRAADTIQLLFLSKNQRARVFDRAGEVVADSDVINDRIRERALPPARKRGDIVWRWPWDKAHTAAAKEDAAEAAARTRARTALHSEVAHALTGDAVSSVRTTEGGSRVVSVSIPIRRVAAVLGVLTLEANDVDQIVTAQRLALIPFILIATAAVLGSSLLGNSLVAQPIIRLANAADSIRLSRARTMSLPDLAERDDEVGDLTRSLEAMTQALSKRMDAIEHFAADVSHEIKNPLTSIRSAVETLELAPSAAAQARLLPILKNDVGRLDRLITDISNASRLDAELSRDAPRRVDLVRLLGDLASAFDAAGQTRVVFHPPDGLEPPKVVGREGPLGQVFRNLIENAVSFSPPGGMVTTVLVHDGRNAVVTVEDEGPGIPPDNLTSVFERFYTERPKGQTGDGARARAGFGGHSGLGLSIARQIVEAHGGTIGAENRVDPDGAVAGARFIVSLPEAVHARAGSGQGRG